MAVDCLSVKSLAKFPETRSFLRIWEDRLTQNLFESRMIEEANEPRIRDLSSDNIVPFIDDDGSIYFLLVSPPVVVEKILELAALRTDETIYDLGSGDGRIIISATQKYGAKAVGIESNKELFELSKKRIRELGLEDLVRVVWGDLHESDFSDADVVVVYLGYDDIDERMRSKLERKLMSGGRIITVNTSIPGWKPKKLEKACEANNSHVIYLYMRSIDPMMRTTSAGQEEQSCFEH